MEIPANPYDQKLMLSMRRADSIARNMPPSDPAQWQRSQQGSITLRAWSEDDHVCISVQDTGPGIPPEKREGLFTPFHQLERHAVGSGLGLAIARSLVQCMGLSPRNWRQFYAGRPGPCLLTCSFASALAFGASCDCRRS